MTTNDRDLFDYITDDKFKSLIVSDYTELQLCKKAGAWKSVHVLAGGIVEALLIDYLSWTDRSEQKNEALLKMMLAEAITRCHKDGVISERTSQLCSVVKSYRNLIHAGKMIRKNEETPDKSSATVAAALVDMIAREIGTYRSSKHGLSASQILSKVCSDDYASDILEHLLEDVSEKEKETLLTRLFPEAIEYIENNEAPLLKRRISTAFRITLHSSGKKLRASVALNFYEMVRTESSEKIRNYQNNFFRVDDILDIEESKRPIIIERLITSLPIIHSTSSLLATKGLGSFLKREYDISRWLKPIILTIVNGTSEDHAGATEEILGEVVQMKSNTTEIVLKSLRKARDDYSKKNNDDAAHRLVSLIELTELSLIL
ncbi:hypothetical protein [Xanthomonas oryzae]|uniref:hypothetical protein n=1 Tax=Xanthomonas oryzae TaxID=347 RepID=UPI00117D582A|nr:hypothetical protein [Xanthomonas oryzae]